MPIRTPPIRRLVLTLGLTWFSLNASVARATLGEASTSVERVRQTFGAARHASVSTPAYTVHEVANDGLTIREYANSSGTIFAVVWSAVTHPDLRDLLGAYADDFSQAHQATKHERARSSVAAVHGSKVVVVRSGHMRAVQGRAYLPNLMPAGVTVDELN